MAQKIIMTLTDDLDGSEAAETVSFSFENSSFEIELSEANATELREILAPYRAAGRRMSGSRTAKKTRLTASTAGVRKWAADNDIQVAARGRVSEEILKGYAASLN
jgi:hypothetical protein